MKRAQLKLTCATLLLSMLCSTACVEDFDVQELPTGGDLMDKATPAGGGASTVNNGGGEGPTGGTQVLTGNTEPPSGNTEPPSGNTAPPPPLGNEEAQCAPGALLGPCELCGRGGEISVPLRDDENCPFIDCEEVFSFNLTQLEENLVECRIQTTSPLESNCEGLGACITNPAQYCRGNVEEPYMEPLPYNDCEYVEGCRDQEAPVVVLSEEGTPCEEDTGTCNGMGDCIPNTPVEPEPPPTPELPSCGDVFDISYDNDNELCSEVVNANSLTCTYYVERNNNPIRPGNEYSCDEFCNYFGATCVDTWNDNENNHCQVRTDNRDCNDRGLNTYVCQCAFEPPPQPQP